MLQLCGCSGTIPKDRILTVTDLKGESKAVCHVGYDDRGRVVNYGETTIAYDGRVIQISETTPTCGGKGLRTLTELRPTNGGFHSRTSGWMKVGKEEMQAIRTADFQEVGDTLVVTSLYRTPDERTTLRQGRVVYVCDEEHNIREVITRFTNLDGEEEACHSYYDYGGNIQYVANLNLQSYLVDTEGTETFFYLLLNLSGRGGGRSLPNRIKHCVRHGKAIYLADGLYRLHGDLLNKAEVISDEAKLKVRLEFEYFK